MLYMIENLCFPFLSDEYQRQSLFFYYSIYDRLQTERNYCRAPGISQKIRRSMSTNTSKKTTRKGIQGNHGTGKPRGRYGFWKIGESLIWSLRPPYFILNILYMAKTLYRFSVVLVSTVLAVWIAKYLSDTYGFDPYVAQFSSTLVMTSLAVYFIIRDLHSYRVFNISLWEMKEGELWAVEVPIDFDNKTTASVEIPKKKVMSAETRRKISEKAKIREQKKREQKARFEKTRKVTEAKKKRASVKK